MSSCCARPDVATNTDFVSCHGARPFLERHSIIQTHRRVWPVIQPNVLRVHSIPSQRPYPQINNQLPPEPDQLTGVTRAWPYGGAVG